MPAAGMPEVIEAPAPRSSTGSELSIRSDRSLPGEEVRMGDVLDTDTVLSAPTLLIHQPWAPPPPPEPPESSKSAGFVRVTPM